MAETLLPDSNTVIGNLRYSMTDHTGPASYTTGGETIGTTNPGPAFLNMEWLGVVLAPGLSVSGTYWVLPQPTGLGARKTYKLIWYLAGTFTQVTAATNLSAEVVRLAIVGR